jgi:hypothetical protein
MHNVIYPEIVARELIEEGAIFPTYLNVLLKSHSGIE